MANLAAALKSEITRLSRKEVRAATEPLKRTIAALRKEIQVLKRDAVAFRKEKRVAPSKPAESRGDNAGQTSGESKQRMTAAGIKTLRNRLGLSAEEMGRLVEASGQSVYKWERGVKPRSAQMTKLVALRSIGKREAAARLK